MIIVVCGLLLIGCFAYVFQPAILPAHGEEKTQLHYLEERREAIYENLRDLSFEHKAGKFTQADFETMRASLESEAAAVLAEIAALSH